MKNKNNGFSMVEILVALSIIAILAAILVPQYIQLKAQSQIQIAQQQVDTVQKAVLAWLGSQPSVAAGSSTYGTSTTSPSTAAWSSISNYLDPGFITSSGLQVVNSGTTVSYFTTTQMQGIQGASVNGGPSTAYGVIFWPVDGAGVTPRESGQPVCALVVPPATPPNATIAGILYSIPLVGNGGGNSGNSGSCGCSGGGSCGN